MTQIEVAIPFNAELGLADWNPIRGLSQTYDVAAALPTGVLNIAISGTTPPNFSINAAGVITADLPHLYTTEVETLQIGSSVGNLNLQVNLRDWFPNDSEIDLSTFHSASRSFDGSAQELWRGLYWYPSVSGGNLNTTEAVTVTSGENGYLDFDALVQELVDINSDGILYVTRITDQIDGNDLVAGANAQPMAIALTNGALSTFFIDGVESPFTQRRNGNLFFRGKWNPNAINSQWSGTERNLSVLSATTPVMNNSWGIITVQQKYNGANNRTFRFGDNNSYPGIRDTSTSRYRYNTRGTRPAVLFPGVAVYENPHCVMMTGLLIANGNILRTLESVNLQDVEAHTDNSVIISNVPLNQHNGSGRELDFGDFYWAEGIIYDIPEGNTAGARQAIREDWQTIRTNLANNYTAIIGNDNFDYDIG